ncbi:hypothetical protein BDK51DRAFT_52667 [Blyttiomyces helicus]|uniref:Uncharacterized protein n=1 Tax=Blyttiomyces helicus TaxID=388810 RepID=A0A4P9W329_9FUNG|nr:hypothetical protein BDK51DRAFT_52667 [Blyttiomyces helicus]|eukprot:RKO86681.1 hypothetical protein BDK51DRAFT_52667 [Blyttiomyces helicus]
MWVGVEQGDVDGLGLGWREGSVQGEKTRGSWGSSVPGVQSTHVLVKQLLDGLVEAGKEDVGEGGVGSVRSDASPSISNESSGDKLRLVRVSARVSRRLAENRPNKRAPRSGTPAPRTPKINKLPAANPAVSAVTNVPEAEAGVAGASPGSRSGTSLPVWLQFAGISPPRGGVEGYDGFGTGFDDMENAGSWEPVEVYLRNLSQVQIMPPDRPQSCPRSCTVGGRNSTPSTNQGGSVPAHVKSCPGSSLRRLERMGTGGIQQLVSQTLVPSRAPCPSDTPSDSMAVESLDSLPGPLTCPAVPALLLSLLPALPSPIASPSSCPSGSPFTGHSASLPYVTLPPPCPRSTALPSPLYTSAFPALISHTEAWRMSSKYSVMGVFRRTICPRWGSGRTRNSSKPHLSLIGLGVGTLLRYGRNNQPSSARESDTSSTTSEVPPDGRGMLEKSQLEDLPKTGHMLRIRSLGPFGKGYVFGFDVGECNCRLTLDDPRNASGSQQEPIRQPQSTGGLVVPRAGIAESGPDAEFPLRYRMVLLTCSQSALVGFVIFCNTNETPDARSGRLAASANIKLPTALQ